MMKSWSIEFRTNVRNACYEFSELTKVRNSRPNRHGAWVFALYESTNIRNIGPGPRILPSSSFRPSRVKWRYWRYSGLRRDLGGRQVAGIAPVGKAIRRSINSFRPQLVTQLFHVVVRADIYRQNYMRIFLLFPTETKGRAGIPASPVKTHVTNQNMNSTESFAKMRLGTFENPNLLLI